MLEQIELDHSDKAENETWEHVITMRTWYLKTKIMSEICLTMIIKKESNIIGKAH